LRRVGYMSLEPWRARSGRQARIKIIKTQQKGLKAINASQNLSQSVLEAVQKYFCDLYEALADGFPIEEFTLENDGYIVILEAGDDANDLSKAGINGGLDAVRKQSKE